MVENLLTHEKNVRFASRQNWICSNSVTLDKLLNFISVFICEMAILIPTFQAVMRISDNICKACCTFSVHNKYSGNSFLFKANLVFHKPILGKLYPKGYVFCLWWFQKDNGKLECF